MLQPVNPRSHRWIALLACALPATLGCGTSHQEKTAMSQSTPLPTPTSAAADPTASPQPSSAKLQTATFALG